MKPSKHQQRVHDRRAQGLPINAVVSSDVVDDPYSYIGEKITVTRSLRDDPLAAMFARNQIEEYELRAGREYQRYFDLSQIGGIKAFDPTKAAVDGGRLRDPLSLRQMAASDEIAKGESALGLEGAALMRDILGAGMSISDASSKRGIATRDGREYIGKRFREGLNTLAKVWKFA